MNLVGLAWTEVDWLSLKSAAEREYALPKINCETKGDVAMRLFETLLARNMSSGLPLRVALQKTIDAYPEQHLDLIARATDGEKVYFDHSDQAEFSDFTTAVKVLSERDGLTLAASVRKCVEKYPTLHRRYFEELREGTAHDQ